MSKAALEGRQATRARPDDMLVGGFADDGREVVKKTYKSGKPAEKPTFFMGGCEPVVPTGPKRKLRTSWMASAPQKEEPPPPIVKPTKRWTPPGGAKKKAVTHDGTTSSTAQASAAARKARKPFKPTAVVKEEQEEDESEKDATTSKEEPTTTTKEPEQPKAAAPTPAPPAAATVVEEKKTETVEPQKTRTAPKAAATAKAAAPKAAPAKKPTPRMPRTTARSPVRGRTSGPFNKKMQTHDGTMASSAATPTNKPRWKPAAKKPAAAETEEEKKEPAPSSPVEQAKAKVPMPTTATPASPAAVKKETPVVKPRASWKPPAASAVNIRKAVNPAEQDAQSPAKQPKPKAATVSNGSSNGKCSGCSEKDTLIQKQAAEIDKLKKEKGELAREVKKIKGSQKMNVELKDEVFELKQQVNKNTQKDANSKNFHKLENKLNTLKMVMDGFDYEETDDVDELKEHLKMLHMVLNQNLKKEGLKNIWA